MASALQGQVGEHEVGNDIALANHQAGPAHLVGVVADTGQVPGCGLVG